MTYIGGNEILPRLCSKEEGGSIQKVMGRNLKGQLDKQGLLVRRDDYEFIRVKQLINFYM